MNEVLDMLLPPLVRRWFKPTAPQATTRSPAFYTLTNQNYGPVPPDLRTKGYSFLVCGFPKSGNTWMVSLVACCLDIDVREVPSPEATTPYVYYTHDPFRSSMLHDPLLVRGAVIVRDLRDVIVSLYHWLRTDSYLGHRGHGPHQVYTSIEEMYVEYFLRRFVNIQFPLETLADPFVRNGWPVIRYEHLFDNPRVQLERLFKTWGIPVSSDKIQAAIDRSSLSNMQKGGGKAITTITSSHFRKGGHGAYKEEIPPHIQKDIENRFGDYLRSFGYVV